MVFSALVSVPFCRRSQSVEGHEQVWWGWLQRRANRQS